MSLKVAVQMDPLEAIKIEGDTTFLMMLSAQARGNKLWVYSPAMLSQEDGRLTARGYHRVLRLAWTIADLAGHEQPGTEDGDIALQLRQHTKWEAA